LRILVLQHVNGLQFHLELTEATAAEGGALPAYAAGLEAVKRAGALAAQKTAAE
jgi:hypothetical protein